MRDPLPSNPLLDALTIQRNAAALGFDWPDVSGVMAKVREETDEVEQALAAQDANAARHELGDLLFSAVNLARFVDADPVEALQKANARFEERFSKVKAEVRRRGRLMEECDLAELDAIWESIKDA